jgi:glycosyltransferase involved in cell wall biosynthesis
MHLILIGNFLSDKQESMNRFAQILHTGFREAGHTAEIWQPKAYFSARSRSTISGIGKWLAYIDKWIVFPIQLRWRLQNKALKSPSVHFHICDHSNAPYLNYLPADRTVITCHDVLAIRGALGYADAYCPASGAGKILQRWILSHLRKAKRLGADSDNTLRHLYELVAAQAPVDKIWEVIHVSFNADFRPMEWAERAPLLQSVGIDVNESFLLCVGSALPRKNRKLLLDMAAELGTQWTGRICYAGQAIEPELMQHARSLGLQERVISVTNPSHVTLVALYSSCSALVFPSFSEGFGWPVIEAQACGAPVIASNIEPMPEVSGGAALHADPTKPQAFAKAFMTLQDNALRMDIIQRGFANCKRFELNRMIKAYLKLHSEQYSSV